MWSLSPFRLEKANAQIITRSRSGVPQAMGIGITRNSTSNTNMVEQLVSGKATPEEIKEKMEQQLRMQRAAHQQKRALETLKSPGNLTANPTTQLVKVTTNSNDGTVKLVPKIAIPANPNSVGKSQLTSLLTTPTQNKTFLGTRRIYMTKCEYFKSRSIIFKLSHRIV